MCIDFSYVKNVYLFSYNLKGTLSYLLIGEFTKNHDGNGNGNVTKQKV